MGLTVVGAIALSVLGGSSALAQENRGRLSPSPNVALFEQFFRRIAEITTPSDQPFRIARAAGERVVVLQPPNLPEVLGLSDADVAKLAHVASQCNRDLDVLFRGEPWVYESRVQMLIFRQLSTENTERVR